MVVTRARGRRESTWRPLVSIQVGFDWSFPLRRKTTQYRLWAWVNESLSYLFLVKERRHCSGLASILVSFFKEFYYLMAHTTSLTGKTEIMHYPYKASHSRSKVQVRFQYSVFIRYVSFFFILRLLMLKVRRQSRVERSNHALLAHLKGRSVLK